MIYSDRPNAPLYTAAFSTLRVLVSTSIGAGAEFGANFVIRVALIAAAGIYVVAALSVLEHILPPPDPTT